jgi:hypothetical protein
VYHETRNKKYCSKGCRKGFKLSEIAKQHHREAALKAHARSHYMVGEKNPRFGVSPSKESREKHSASLKKYYEEHPEKRPTGSKNGMFGKKQKPESIERGRAKTRGTHYHTDLHKKELSERLKRINPMDTPESRKKRSESLIGKLVGDKNPNWRGGLSYGIYCPKFNQEFKERVRAFYEYTCQVCGHVWQPGEKRLSVHHVNYEKKACCGDNFIPLFVPVCSGKCHPKTNGRRDYWERIFTGRINGLFGGKCYFTKEEMRLYTGKK